MPRNWTRRRFLTTASAAAGLAATNAGQALGSPRTGAPVLGVSAFSASARETLVAAMDELIPAFEDMRAASKAGGLDGLETIASSDADLRRDLKRAADSLAKRAKPKTFSALSSENRIVILAALEKEEAPLFATLRDCVYESYYLQPEIWSAIGFEFVGPDRPGPGLGSFDETILERVRGRAPSYRKT
jgi:hypothetical protein